MASRVTGAFRQEITKGNTVWCAGVYDALSALLARDAGFGAVMTGGYVMTAAMLAMPDAGFLTLSENAGTVRNVAGAVDVPVIADIDTGYGNALNVKRTIRDIEAAGAAGAILEDQVNPKRCPITTSTVEIISIEEAVGKIEAAVDARLDPDFAIIARTDAADPDEAIARARAYARAGADLIQPISRTFSDFAGLRALRDAVPVPLSLQLLGWLETDLSKEQVEAVAGLATYPLVALMSAAAAIRSNLGALAKGDASALPAPTLSSGEFHELIGYRELDQDWVRYVR